MEKRIGEIEERRAKLEVLLTQFAALGERGRSLNHSVVEISQSKKEGNQKELLPRLDEVLARLDELIAGALQLVQAADAEQMEDVSRDADALRKQLQGARNKVNLLAQQIRAV